tara:strand:+ start:674 stop:2695 length:2022 start_codon:yes stop_codon:yes gene_type:complete
MSKFNIDLEHARKRQTRLYILLVGGAIFIFMAVVVPLALVNGTFVEISPKEASQIAELRVTRGPALAIGNKVYSFAGSIGLEVTAKGYLPAQLEISGEDKAEFIEVTLAEAPGILKATTVQGLETTSWYLNGRVASVSPNLEVELPDGEHELTIDNRFFEKKALKVSIRKGKTTDLKIDLEPMEGLLKLASTPSGAVVKLNGKQIGETPQQIELAGGSYSIELNHPERKNLSDKIEITNSRREVERDYKLLFEDAFVSFKLKPAGGILLLNGRRLNKFERMRVDALKTHTVSYLKDGYFAESKKFKVDPNEEKKLAFLLKKELGRVVISSKPSAAVFLNGKQIGMTPISTELPAIKHNLEISKKGYRSFKQSLLPSSKSAKKINVTLQTELQARLAENPKSFKNSAGMTLKLFHPNRFKMGAPRGEKGQRANEFQRSIRLSKPIYVSIHEVTVEQFSKFKTIKPIPSNKSFPITNVSWNDAALFCNWLSQQDRLEPFYRFSGGQYIGENREADGYRLPTEAEWEWLARKAGRQKTSRFTWGDEYIIPPSSGNFADESAKGTVDLYIPRYDDGHPRLAAVGSFGPDKAGLFDISGNVSEWVHDRYSLLPPKPGQVEIDPFGSSYGDSHVVKGSNWRSGSLTELRAAFRDGVKGGRADVGFRVVRYLYGKNVATK